MGRDGAVVAVRRRRSRTRRSAPGGRRSGSWMQPSAPRGRVAGRRADRRSRRSAPAASTAAVAPQPRRQYRAVQTDPRAHLLGGGDPPMGLEPVAPDEVRERPDRRAVAALGEDAAALQRRHRLDDQPVQPPHHRFGRAGAARPARRRPRTRPRQPAPPPPARGGRRLRGRSRSRTEESHGPPTKPGPLAGARAVRKRGRRRGRSARGAFAHPARACRQARRRSASTSATVAARARRSTGGSVTVTGPGVIALDLHGQARRSRRGLRRAGVAGRRAARLGADQDLLGRYRRRR